VISHKVDVLNPILKAILPMVEWEFFIMNSICIFHCATMILLLLLSQSYLGIIFWYVDAYEFLKEIFSQF